MGRVKWEVSAEDKNEDLWTFTTDDPDRAEEMEKKWEDGGYQNVSKVEKK